MKSTGIVRRIDDLGRVVIPKEIRNSLFIKEGTPMEIHITDNREIILKKYDVVNDISDMAQSFCEVVYSCLQFPTIITSTNGVVACEGLSKKTYLGKELSEQIKNLIDENKNYLASKQDNTTLIPIIVNEDIKFISEIIIPIICNGKCEGSIILISEESMPTNIDVKVIQALSCLISKLLG